MSAIYFYHDFLAATPVERKSMVATILKRTNDIRIHRLLQDIDCDDVSKLRGNRITSIHYIVPMMNTFIGMQFVWK